ncbi:MULTISPECIES: hypothetical protein [Planktothrix]|uniref:Uncharacterized protein n=1 Tax=Planktothrix mougeotii LEGE 06226 TaxID=1828728 RepID=A0ABR9UKU0_9CYAN|nr:MULTISPECIES: hypothetical protein [Planktothrix]MBD2485839.1 hypothetical protein [Planktothrix sp. FACHB-1365]MBE9146416.1 hypothetical protein [Planktothrix mougeotii LEGE 06226]
MPIPFILGAIALGTAAYGVVKGKEGVDNMKEANEMGQRAQKRHKQAVNQLQSDWETTNKLAEEYGQQQLNIKIDTIRRFVAFIEQIGQRAKQDLEFLEGLEGISVQQIQEYKTDVMEAEQFFKGGIKAVVAGAAAGQAATGLATSVGVASTGAAISGLSGAAAWNATLAWLGGGSLAAGGGGMALGTVVLGGITVAPALAVGGFVIAGKGEKALTEAREYKAKVNVQIAQIETAKEFLQQVRCRIDELSIVVDNLNKCAVLSLNQLESQPFERKRDATKFQQVALLIKALAEIMKTPILDSEGKLNPATAAVQAKYRTLGDS